MRLAGLFVVILMTGFAQASVAQHPYRDRLHQFLSFEAIPTWTGVVTDWEKASPKIHLYDSEQYKGHAQYVSAGLGTGITFATFKAQVKDPATRRFMPFFLFDLRSHPVQIDGKAHTWALRIEDYSYTDTEAQITAATRRLLDLVRQYIDAATGGPSHGIVVLSGNPQSLPYKSIAPALAEAGYPYRSINQLVELAGGKQVQVLNAGLGYGYLRYIPSGQSGGAMPQPHEIVVYEALPYRLPPVAGIVTIEPQTPLSHVNLLAMNRGTFNVFAIDTAAIPGLHRHIGQLVRMEAKAGKLTLHVATLQEAQRHWDGQRRHVELPLPDSTLRQVVDFAQPRTWTAHEIGAKAANYALLQQKFPTYVKPGMAIPFGPYLQVMRQSGADQLVARLTADAPRLTPDSIAGRLAAIRDRILDARFPAAWLAETRKTLRQRFPGQSLRLRSSTNCEDLPNFNGAGLYLSTKWDTEDHERDLEGALLEVYASLWTPIAWAERAYYGIDHRHAAMAVQVNPSFRKEYANGVALTVPAGNGFAIVVNSQFGETAITNPDNGVIPEAIRFATATSPAFTVQSKSSIGDIYARPGWEARALELRDLVVQVHKVIGASAPQVQGKAYGVDIEFKVMQEGGGYRLYIKQARLLGQVLPE